MTVLNKQYTLENGIVPRVLSRARVPVGAAPRRINRANPPTLRPSSILEAAVLAISRQQPPANREAQPVVNSNNSASGSVAHVISSPASDSKEWHRSITSDYRKHLIVAIVQAIFPAPSPAAMLDKRMLNLVAYARKLEGDTYDTAATLSDYYHLIAGKIYKLQKALEEKRQNRMAQDGPEAKPQKASDLTIQKCIQSLINSHHCKDANCRLPSCYKMKHMFQHSRVCKRGSSRGCIMCKQLMALCCCHAKHCQEIDCSVPLCNSIRRKLKEARLKQRLEQAHLSRRNTTEGTGNIPTPVLIFPQSVAPEPAPATHTLPADVQEEAVPE